MKTYYSTFIPGLLDPVCEALAAELPESRVLKSLDGLIVYESNAQIESIRKLPFVTNSFGVLKSFQGDLAKTVESMASSILRDRALTCNLPFLLKPRSTFRVIVSSASQLVTLDAKLLRQLERWIKNRTALSPNRSKPDVEFWLVRRTEGCGFFSVRVSKHKAYDKILSKGELRPELANILCRLSDPVSGELFLDPFCGSGAIPIQRARFFPLCLVIASDKDEQKGGLLRGRIKTLALNKRIVVRSDDALHLIRYSDGSIHKIVTDPPWGHFSDTEMPIEDFYREMMAEFVRVLRRDGKIVLLTAESAAMEKSLGCFQDRLTVSRRFNVLVSGKKASIFVLTPI